MSFNDFKAPNFQHFIITKFGLGIYNQQWYEHRLHLLESITWPSIKNQSNTNFKWIISVDDDIPLIIYRYLKNLFKNHHNVVILKSGFSHLYASTQFNKYIKSELIQSKSTHVITSRIDDDDSLNDRTIENVQNIFLDEFKNGIDRLCITFKNGFEFDLEKKTLKLVEFSFPSMSGHMISPTNDYRSCYDIAHNKLDVLAENHNYKIIYECTGIPMWIYVRHKQVDNPYLMPEVGHYIDMAISKHSLLPFNIDYEKLNDYYQAKDQYPPRKKLQLSNQYSLAQQINTCKNRIDSEESEELKQKYRNHLNLLLQEYKSLGA